MQLSIYSIRGLIFSLISLAVAPDCGVAQDIPAGTAVNIPADTAVHTGVLPNGFTYYIRHNGEPAKRVQLYLVNKVGSVLEDEDQRGLAHFMEHMNFNGTRHFPGNELVNYLQKAGVRFGADLNAYTSFDETVYQLPIPTDDTAILQNGFRIMRDWAQEATLDSVEIEKERGVVLEEKRLGKGAGERMQRQYFPLILNHSRYAERIPIGLETVLTQFKPATIRRFHHDWYRPDLQALIVVGDIDVKATETLVRTLFADLRNPTDEKTRTQYKIALTGKDQFMTVTDKEMPEINIQVLVKHPEPKMKTVADYRLAMERELFNQVLAARFAELSQQPNPPFVNAGAEIQGFLGGLDMFAFDLTARQGEIEKGFRTAWELIEKVKRYGFTETELARAKTDYLSAMESEFKEKDKTPSVNFTEEYQRLFLEEEASPGTDWEYHFVKDHIASISLADINALIKEYIRDTDRDILVLAPDAAKAAISDSTKGGMPGADKGALPDSATMNSWIAGIAREALAAYTDQAPTQPLMATRPAPGKVIDAKQIAPLDITELRLQNGVTIMLKPTDFKKDEILISGVSAGGTSLYPDAELPSADNAAGLIGGFGVGSFSPIQLSKVLNGKQVSVTPWIGERGQGISGDVVPGDLETALQLINLWFTAPRKDTVLFNNIINNSKEVISNRYNDPDNVFSDTVAAVLSNYSGRRKAPSLDILNRIDLYKAYSIFKERFADAAGFRFVFVGNFNVDSIRPLLETYLGSLPALNKNEQARDLHINIPPGKIDKVVYKGTENKATVRMVYSGKYEFSPAANLQINALAEVLQIRLIQHLREDESEVYSPSVNASYRKNPENRFSVTVTFGCAPKNADHLAALVDEEIANIREHGALPDDVAKCKAEFLRTHELQLRENQFWLSYLGNQLENKEPILQVLDWENMLNGVTPQSLQSAARQYLSGTNRIRFTLLPQNKP